MGVFSFSDNVTAGPAPGRLTSQQCTVLQQPIITNKIDFQRLALKNQEDAKANAAERQCIDEKSRQLQNNQEQLMRRLNAVKDMEDSVQAERAKLLKQRPAQR